MSVLDSADGTVERRREAPGRSRPGARGARSARLGWSLVLLAGLGWSLWGAGVWRRAVANPGGLGMVGRFAGAAVHPDVAGSFVHTIASATLVTLAYAVLGTATAVGLGVLGGLFLSQTWWIRNHGPAAVHGRRVLGARSVRWGGWLSGRALLALPRGVHEAVWGLVLVNVLGPDPLVGVLAIGLPYAAITAKVYADLIDEAPQGPYVALLASGAGRRKAYAYGLLPQTLADMFSYGWYRFDCSIRSAVILGIIGAGGLGYQLDASFQALNYRQMWTAIYATVVICGVADLASHRLRHRLGVPRTAGPRHPHGDRSAPARDRWLTAAGVAGVALAAWSWWYLALEPAHLWSARARSQAAFVAGRAWPPAHGSAFVAQLWQASLRTVQMSILAMVLATGAAMLLAPLAARSGTGAGRATVPLRAASAACRGVLLLLRAIPAPVWAFVLLFVLLPGPLPGAVALAAYNLGVLGRLMGEAIENLPPAPQRALLASGAGRVQTFLYAVAPRALPRFLAYGLYRWEVAVRETIVVGLVGAGGLGLLLERQVAGFDWHAVASTLVALVVLTFFVDMVSAAARRAIR